MWVMLTLCTALAVPGASPVIQGTVTTDDGVTLQYRIVGKSDETVVVPVGVLIAPYLDQLARGRRVVYYDPRGRGDSDTGELSRVSLDRNIQDLEILRRELGLERMALIGFSGHSFGCSQIAAASTRSGAAANAGAIARVYARQRARASAAVRSRSYSAHALRSTRFSIPGPRSSIQGLSLGGTGASCTRRVTRSGCRSAYTTVSRP